MDFKTEYTKYEQTLATLNEQCGNAERQSIVCETNLTNLCNQRDRLVEECEAFTGTTIDKVPEILQQKRDELAAIMSKLGAVDITAPVTQDKLDVIKAIVDEFSIAPVQ